MSAGELTMLLFNMYVVFLILALAVWLITVIDELRSTAPTTDSSERAVVE